MKIKISLCFLLFLLSFKIFCQINVTKNPIKKHFDPLDYNGGLQNWHFDQDNNGILFVANDQGVLEFDGDQWIMHKLPMATRTRSIFVDSDNKIYVGSDNQIGYFKNSEQGLQFLSFKKDLQDKNLTTNAILKILKVKGNVYFLSAGESKILKYNGNQFEFLQGPGYIQNIFEHHNQLILQIYDQGLFKLKNGEFIAVPKTKNISDIASIIPINKEESLIFCRNGSIHSYKSKTLIKTFGKHFNEINTVEKLSMGGYAVGTQNRGLFILDSKLEVKYHYTKNKGLTHATVKAIYEDQFKNLWVALNSGIDYLKINLPFRLIDDETGVEGTGYCATNFKGRTYLGTNNGVFYVNNSANNDKFKLLEGSEGQVWGFSKIHDELILNHNKGAFVVNKNISKFHDIGSWTFIETKNPNMILGGDYHGIQFFEKHNGEWLKKGQVPNLNESSRILHFENDTTLWMTHGYKGAYKIQFDDSMVPNHNIMHFGQHSGFPSDILISAYKLNGKLIFTSENGIFNFKQDSLCFFTNKFLNNKLGTNHISHINQKNNNIYYIQDEQIGRLEEKNFGQYNIETSVFKHVNKLINFDLGNISFLDAKNILIGAKKGFVHYNPNMKYNIVTNFQTLIKSVRILHNKDSIQTLFPLNKLKLLKEKEIDINFTSPYFENTDELKYRYRLLPMDENWSEPININHKSYAYLPYGDYRFEVKAINLYGNESKIASLPFEIITPWYASNMAKVFYVLIFLSIIFLFPYVQQNKFRKEKLTLEKSNRIKLEVKDKKIDYLYNENLKNELNLKNNQLTAVTMQLLKNKEFIVEVQQKISSAISKTNSEKELKRLVKTIDLELSEIDYWDQFSYHFEQVHGNYLNKIKEINVKLSPNELKLVAFLRMNMSSKEISKLMNITVRGVEIARYRIRKKFNLSRGENLVNFLISLDKTQNI